jgi:ABC-type bacteriocin/lantibiotic exporter with double-glycine peptidase domain
VIAGVTLFKTFNSSEFIDKVPNNISMVLVWLISIILILALVVLFWLFYRLIYGILLNKLEKNYNELVNNETDLS